MVLPMLGIVVSIQLGGRACVVNPQVMNTPSEGPDGTGLRVTTRGETNNFPLYAIFLFIESEAGVSDLGEECYRYVCGLVLRLVMTDQYVAECEGVFTSRLEVFTGAK